MCGIKNILSAREGWKGARLLEPRHFPCCAWLLTEKNHSNEWTPQLHFPLFNLTAIAQELHTAHTHTAACNPSAQQQHEANSTAQDCGPALKSSFAPFSLAQCASELRNHDESFVFLPKRMGAAAGNELRCKGAHARVNVVLRQRPLWQSDSQRCQCCKSVSRFILPSHNATK